LVPSQHASYHNKFLKGGKEKKKKKKKKKIRKKRGETKITRTQVLIVQKKKRREDPSVFLHKRGGGVHRKGKGRRRDWPVLSYEGEGEGT